MKRIKLVSALISIVLLAAGCSNKATTTSNKSNEVDLSKVTLVIGDQANSTKTKMEAAKALEGVPYKIEWANFQGAAPLFEAVRSGQVDTAYAGDTPVLSAAVSGVPIKIVATNVTTPKGITILASKDSLVKTATDLKGKTVVVSSAKGSVSEYLLIQALKEVGLTTNDVTVKYILPTDALAAFIAGQIEIWATFDPYAAMAENQGARVIRDGVNINTGMSFITAYDKSIQDPGKRAAIQDFLKRYQKSTEWTNENLDEYTKVYAKLTRLDENVAKQVLSRQGKVSTRTVSNEDVSKLQKVADVFYEAKALTSSIDVKTIVDQSVFTDKK